MSAVKNYLLLTGATGLVGRYLLRDLLLDGRHVAVMARSTDKQSAAERVEAILVHWEEEMGVRLNRPVVLEGDLSERGLGLNGDARTWIRRNVIGALHNAAVLHFHGKDPAGEPWRTNVNGVEAFIDFCREADIREMDYVSTAYVCGDREGVIYERDLNEGQDFKNDYEKSKHSGENLIRNAGCFDRLAIYRPAVIAGDSVTGYTSTYHGLYLYLRLMAMLVPAQPKDAAGRRYTPIRLPMTGEERRNVVPVDWVSQVISALSDSPKANGEVFHLAPEAPLTPRRIIDAAYSYFNSTGVEYIGCGNLPTPEEQTEFEKRFYSGMWHYAPYERLDPTFDCSTLHRLAGHLPCPDIDEAMIHRYLKFGEEDKWGRRREKPTKVPRWIQQWIDDSMRRKLDQPWFATLGRRLNGTLSHGGVVGLDVCGPGGGQWTVEFDKGRCIRWEPGLTASCEYVLALDADEFAPLNEESAGRQN